MSDPLVQKPSGLYRPKPMLSAGKNIAGPPPGPPSLIGDASNSLSGLSVSSTGELADPLMDNLLFMYKMNETGAQTDQVFNFRNLVARNSPANVTGKINNCQQYNTGAVCHYYNGGIGANNNAFSISCWLRSDAAPSAIDHYFYNLENNTGYTISIRHRFSLNQFLFLLSPDSGSTQYVLSSTVTITVGVWYNLIIVYTPDTSIQMWTNNADPRSNFAASGRADGRMVFGAQTWTGAGSRQVSVDAFHFWDSYALDAADRAYMFNGGVGRELL